jgi:hypothetical protein
MERSMFRTRKTKLPWAEGAMREQFRGYRLPDLVTARCAFSLTARVDGHFVLDKLFADDAGAASLGPYTQFQRETITIAHLLGNADMPVVRTKGARAAFVKEHMRRAAPFYLPGGARGAFRLSDADSALDEILFSGGSRNAKLLGGSEISPALVANGRISPAFSG